MKPAKTVQHVGVNYSLKFTVVTSSEHESFIEQLPNFSRRFCFLIIIIILMSFCAHILQVDSIIVLSPSNVSVEQWLAVPMRSGDVLT